MAMLNISKTLAEQIETVAQSEGRPIETVLSEMVHHYQAIKQVAPLGSPPELDDFEGMFGILKSDVNDLSERTSGFLRTYFEKRP